SHGAVEERTQRRTEVDAEMAFTVERLASHDAHEVGVLPEEVERHVEHEVDLLPAATIAARGLLDLREPVGERALEHLAVQRLLRREVVQEARASDADTGCDVVEGRPLVALVREAVQRLSEDRLTRRRHVLAVGHVPTRLPPFSGMPTYR